VTRLLFTLIETGCDDEKKVLPEVLVLSIAIVFSNGIGIAIANTFLTKYWYWQYFYKVLLTTLHIYKLGRRVANSMYIQIKHFSINNKVSISQIKNCRNYCSVAIQRIDDVHREKKWTTITC